MQTHADFAYLSFGFSPSIAYIHSFHIYLLQRIAIIMFRSILLGRLLVLLLSFLLCFDLVTSQYRSTTRLPLYEENFLNSDPRESNQAPNRDSQQQHPAIRYNLTDGELANEPDRSNSLFPTDRNRSIHSRVDFAYPTWVPDTTPRPSQPTSGNSVDPTNEPTTMPTSTSTPEPTATNTNTNTNRNTNTNTDRTTQITTTACVPCLIGGEPNDAIKSFVSKAVKDAPTSTTSIWVLLSILLIVVLAFVMPMLVYLYLTRTRWRRGSLEDGRQGLKAGVSSEPGDSPLSEAFGVTTSHSTRSPPPPPTPQHSNSNRADARSYRPSREKSKSSKKLTKNTIPIFKRITLN